MRDKKEPTASAAAFQKNKKQVQANDNPMDLGNKLTEATHGISQHAPNIVQGLMNSVFNAQQFLSSKIPHPLQALPLSSEYRPTKSEMAKFNDYHATVSDPLTVLKHIQKGTLRKEHLEALTAVYPQLYDDMKKKIVEHMNPEKARTLNYGVKAALAKFMGQPLDASMLPQSILANQAALSGPKVGSQAAPAGSAMRPTLGGLKDLNNGERYATRTQQDEDEK